ncbi:hypothetical protein FC959_12545 [Clostridium botulinum]|nr:hypothetical protein [Clostridium botulinum]
MLESIRNSINSISICKELFDLLGNVYISLSGNRLTDTIEITKIGVEKCNSLKVTALETHNESLANASLAMSKLFLMYYNYATYWCQLNEKKYKNSWNSLQDTIDNLLLVSRWSSNRCDFYLDTLDMHFKELEKLYPYNIFASSEMVITKAKCNICGKSSLDIECTHIPGNLYWGKMAYTIVEDLTFEGVALVEHPLDKRCVIEIQDENKTNEERFKLLDYFVNNVSNPLMLFSVEKQKRFYAKEVEQKLGRNDRCYCGSGLKFKRCCGKESYVEGIHSVIAPKGVLRLNLPNIES